MATLLYTVALPAAGKDYLYHHHFAIQPKLGEVKMIASDDIREIVFGDVNDQTHNAEVFEIMRKRTLEALTRGENVYYNSTGLSAKRRINFLKQVSKIPDVKKICILIVPPFEKIIEQNANRKRKVPEQVLERMLRGFQVPHISEGWDEIQVFRKDGNYQAIYDMVAAARKIPHDNPHHKNTIGTHMYDAYFYSLRMNYPLIVCEAALCHDVGKPHCKSFNDYRGRKTRRAHYYSHDSVGAYIYLSHSNGTERDLTIANLIAHHMDFFSGEKYLEKVRNRYGEVFYQMLLQLHDADVNSH